MNPVLLFLLRQAPMKKLILLVIATLTVIIAFPVSLILALSNLPLLGLNAIAGGPATNQTIYIGPAMPGDNYDYGNCTYWAALRRMQINDPIPNTWGNAIDWNVNALLDGYLVNHTPSFGAIFQWPAAPGGLGHVAFVENVNQTTGAWTISEMNAVGWDVIDYRTYPAASAADYNFIHNRILKPL